MASSRLASDFQPSDDSLGFLLWQVTNHWQAAQRAALKPLGLTHVQFVLLASLTYLDATSPVTQRDLAAHAATDPMMTSQVLRTLERRALVLRQSHPRDKRARAVTATPTGIELANRALVSVEACDREFFEPVADHGPGFLRLLQTLRDAAAAPVLASSPGPGDLHGEGGIRTLERG